MDWSDPAVQFGSSELDLELKKFCEEPLKDTRRRALELLEKLRASRVTLDYLRQVQSVDVVAGHQQPSASVTALLDDRAANRVKGYLRRKVEKLKRTSYEEFRSLVPQDRDAFERGFDTFVEKCLEKSNIESSWFSDHVASGAAQPQLWKIYIAFQRQLRESCEIQSKRPLPPPLFMTTQDDASFNSRRTHSMSNKSFESRPVGRHGRTQSFAEFGRVPAFEHFPHHQGPVNYPYIPVPSFYYPRQEAYFSGADMQGDFTEQRFNGWQFRNGYNVAYCEGLMFPPPGHPQSERPQTLDSSVTQPRRRNRRRA